MEDHHVDRPGVEAQQCVKLTGTNSSIGLIVLIYQCPQPSRVAQISKDQLHASLFLFDLVAMAKRPEPDPIPNSTVKRFSANGTVS